ncbi:polysaccharide lyase family 7 protein [Aquimarina gracilis]|uniref:Polysaccharide lyase family 7 protein n=1 Tax=Aquimarina gracilis TaxID=874422 RepID=A0ABU5ZV16_9FLAO|nr:polysaccharide lyase family 7 protein [Aquimarina gracilis]MEB3345715.1 polysaccharide lyase family 7 protein [Aquimarina gracilis]
MKIIRLYSLILFTISTTLFYSCSSDSNDETPAETGGEVTDGSGGDNSGGDGSGGDGSGGDGGVTSSNIPFEVLNLTNWKITLPRDFNNDGKADEVYLDKSRNDYSEDPSFKEYKDEFFFVENNNVRFSCPATTDTPTTGNSSNTRSELREMPSNGDGEAGWDANGNRIKTLTFKVRIIQTSSTSKFAFAQIHDFKQDIWDDLLRVQIQSDQPNAKEGETGRIYLLGDVIEGEIGDGFPINFRNNNYDDRYIKDDYILGDWLAFKITVQNSVLKIYLEDMNTPIRTYDNITCKSNYYKAGVYNQSVKADSNGDGIAEFSEIVVSENF